MVWRQRDACLRRLPIDRRKIRRIETNADVQLRCDDLDLRALVREQERGAWPAESSIVVEHDHRTSQPRAAQNVVRGVDRETVDRNIGQRGL